MSNNLRKQVLSGVVWSAVQNWTSRLAGLVIFTAIARILEPEQLGLFAAATIVIALATLFVDQGLSEAIIQKKDIKGTDLNTLAVINFVVAVMLMAVIMVSAPWIADLMKQPGIVDPLRLISLGLVISALYFTQNAMHRRNFQYRRLAFITVVATLASGLAALAMAYAGYGVWSLAIQYLINASVIACLLWVSAQWRFQLRFDFRGVKSLLGFGANRLTAQLLDFAAVRGVEFIIVSKLGGAALGAYAVGTKISQALMQALSAALLDVALNGFSRLNDDRSKLHAAYFKAQRLTATVAVPIFVITACVSEELVLLVFGDRWESSGSVLTWMSVLGAIQVLQFYNGTLLNAVGRPGISTLLLFLKSLVTIGGLLLLSPGNLESAVKIYCVIQGATMIPSYMLVCGIARISFREIFKNVAPAILPSAVAAFMAIIARDQLTQNSSHHLSVLTLLLVVFALTYLPMLFLIEPASAKKIFRSYIR